MSEPIVVINAVGLTPRLLTHAPRIRKAVERGWARPMGDVLPSVTMSAQATLLTGRRCNQHGIVGNGWLFRETNEVRFWQQSNRLMQCEPLYVTARNRAISRGCTFRCAKLFWWFNQGATVDWSITPKPHYGIDGSKVFGVTGAPEGMAERIEREIGPFPFSTFWGPMAGIRCTQWIAASAARVIAAERPELTLVYLPHLDYDPQRFGPSGCDMPKLVGQLDQACEPLLEAAVKIGAVVWVVSEYGHVDTPRPIYLNRVLREAGLLSVRMGPFGEQLETYLSRAFAVCDHQLAHVYVRDDADVPRVRELLARTGGVNRVAVGEERTEWGLDHPRSGEVIALADRDAWFAYPFWIDDRRAPDYARCVAIHHKPGYDPCELFFDPAIRFPKLRVARKIIAKKLGFRMKLDVVPLDATLVRGGHGLMAAHPEDGPLLAADGDMPSQGIVPMTAFRDLLLNRLGLPD